MTATVLITGGSQGIGRAIATRFAQAGYGIAIAARQAERLEAVAAALRSQFQVDVLSIPTDVQQPDQVQQLVQQAIDHFGTVDVLVNNAGVYSSGPVEQFSLEDWHQVLDTNLWGYIHTIHALLPHFIERHQGSIVNICSIGGKVPLPYLAPYATSKFAIAGLTQTLASELKPHNIHVCGIYPNIVQSNFMERAIFRGRDDRDRQERRQQVEQTLQAPFVETPEKVASAVWHAVKHEKDSVLVGSAKLAAGTNSLFPRLLQWILRKTFQHRQTELEY